MKHYYEFGPYCLDVDKRLLLREGKPVSLTPKALDTLFVLVENAGSVLEKEELMKKVWPNSFVEEGNLTVNISLIRKSLGERPNYHQYIVTVPGRGYRFVADVKEQFIEEIELTAEESTRSHILIESEESYIIEPEDTHSAQNSDAAGAIAGLQAKAVAKKALTLHPVSVREKTADNPYSLNQRRIQKLAMIAAFASLMIAAGGIYYKFFSNTGDSIAVMPFVFISTDTKELSGSDSEYLSDGITDGVINSLSQLQGLKVIARSSVFQYKGNEVDPQRIGRELGVRTVLLGRIIQRGDNLTIRTELSDVRDNRHIWGEQYERRISDLLSLQKEIASSIAGNLRLKLTGDDHSRLAKSYTDNAEAYDLYLKGRHNWNKRTVEGFKRGAAFFQRAIEKDPTYALAYTGLADSCMLLSDWGSLPPAEGYSKARDAVTHALSLDGELAEAHTSLAGIKGVLDWDWAGAENEYRRAIELNPNYPTAHHWYATHLMMMRRLDESLTEIKKAQQLDPLSLGINKDYAIILIYTGRYDQALDQCRKTLEIDPDYLVMSIYIAQVYDRKQMYGEAVAELERAYALSPEDPEISCGLALALAAAGRSGEARKILNDLNQPSKQDQFLPREMALLYARLGEKDRAFEILKAASENHYFPIAELNVDPRFDLLRSDARFAELMRRIGLSA